MLRPYAIGFELGPLIWLNSGKSKCNLNRTTRCCRLGLGRWILGFYTVVNDFLEIPPFPNTDAGDRAYVILAVVDRCSRMRFVGDKYSPYFRLSSGPVELVT